MNKKIIFTAVNVVGLLIASLFWLLSEVVPESFGWYNFSYAITIIFAVFGTSFILKGVIWEDSITTKKANILFGAILLLVAVIALPVAIAVPTNVIPPLVCVTIALIAFISIIATAGKKWDEGDNEKAGYRNYYERKNDDKNNTNQ